jgi:hypothetical protein
MIKQMRECLQTGTPLGNDRFYVQIEQALGRSVGFSKRGRPKKSAEEDDVAGSNSAKQLPLKEARSV